MESIVPSWALEHINSKHMTPAQQFTKDHKELVIEGKKWMKEMATSCTIVGALTVTIMFATGHTVVLFNNYLLPLLFVTFPLP